MKRKSAVFCMLMLVFSNLQAPFVSAEHVRVHRSSLKTIIKPWYIEKTTWQDGATGCVASNYHSRKSMPVFSLNVYYKKGEPSSSLIRIDTKTKAGPNEEMKLIIGGVEYKFLHPAKYDHNGYFPETGKQIRQILSGLTSLQKSQNTNKSFYAIDRQGRKFKFDARKSVEVLQYMREECEFSY